MEGSVLLMFLATSSIAVVFSSPIAPGFGMDYDNVPQCMQPAQSGLCLAYIPSFYYNPSKETCESFIFGGCKGNQNRFFSFDECMKKCGGFKPTKDETFTLKLESDSDDEKEISEESSETPETSAQEAEADVCAQPSVMGPCRAMMPRFYFNGLDCESFIYGGCQGNENNFKTVEECKQKCASKSTESSSVAEASAEEASNETSDVSSEEKATAETVEAPEASPEEPTKETSEETSVEAKDSSEQ